MKGLKNIIKAIGVITVLSIAVWLSLLTSSKRQVQEGGKPRRIDWDQVISNQAARNQDARNQVAMRLPSEYKLAMLLVHGKEPDAWIVAEFKDLLDNLVEKCDQPTSRERIAYIITEVHSICRVVVPEQEVARNP